MQINMQIVLTQLEMEEAIRAYVRAEVPVGEDQTITVTFEDDKDGNLQAIVVAEAGGGTMETKPAKATRARNVKAPAVKAAAPEPETEAGPGQTEPAAEAEVEVPWSPVDDGNTAGVVEGATAEAEEQPVIQEAVTATPATGLKIFPDIGTSASSVKESPAPASAAKSLFANLTKPVHDSSKD